MASGKKQVVPTPKSMHFLKMSSIINIKLGKERVTLNHAITLV